MKTTSLLGILAVLVLEAGCDGAEIQAAHGGRAPGIPCTRSTTGRQASSLGNEQWWQVYQDPVLTQLIHTAIACKRRSHRIAAARVLEAQAQVGITRANQLPSANVGADVFSQQDPKITKLLHFPPTGLMAAS